MSFDSEILPSIAAIYRYLYKNPNIHKNTLRKELLNKGKISKDKFSKTLESLIALGKIYAEKECVSLSPEFLKTGVLQKKGNDYFILTPDSKKPLPIGKSVASGFSVGDFIDFMVEKGGEKDEVIVLGRSSKSFESQTNILKPAETKPKKKTTFPQPEMLNSDLTLGRVLRISHDELVFIPNDKSITPRHIPLLNPKEEISAFENKLCVMNLANSAAPILGGSIVEVMGDAGNPIDEYAAIAKFIGAAMNWDNPALRAEIEKIPKSVDVDSLSLISEEEAETNHRGNTVDLRHLAFRPTDPEDARDKDDAIYSTYDEDGNLVVYTAIANVPKYVDLDSLIGQIYMNIIFTFYVPNRAYNVLPSELSAGVCSLRANEDRLAFVVKTVIDKDTGEVKQSNFFDALINCKEEYSYEQAQNIVDSFGDEDLRTHFEYKALTGEPLTPDEQVLMDFYAAQELKRNFEKRRMLRFNTNNEYKSRFDEDQTTILDIDKIKHLPYNEVIEFFMITANEATAEYAKKHKLDTIYRVHDAPNTKKIDRASEFFDILEIEFDGNFSAEGIRNLLEIVKGTHAEDLVNQFLIKMQSRAIYSDTPFNSKQIQTNAKQKGDDSWLDDATELISHFALQSKGYSHSTAPIRRAVDYVVIYNILARIHGTKPLSRNVISTIIENANEMQKMIDEGEKAIKSVNGVLYAENHIGEQLKGRINKLRYTSPEEGYSDEIVAVVINDEKGICAEIPISQITGRKNAGYSLSPKGCAVCDANGNIVVKLCQSLDFFIEKADRQTMNVVGKTNKELVVQAGNNKGKHNFGNNNLSGRGKNGKKVKKYNPNKTKHKGDYKKSDYHRDKIESILKEETFGE